MDMYLPYVNIVFLDRALAVALEIATLDYFKKTIVDFTLPISVFTGTLRNILCVRQNDITKAQVWMIMKCAEASKHSRHVMWRSLNTTRIHLLQSFNEQRSSNGNRLTILLRLTKKTFVGPKKMRTVKQGNLVRTRIDLCVDREEVRKDSEAKAARRGKTVHPVLQHATRSPSKPSNMSTES